MAEPSLHDSRQKLAAALAVALLFGGAGFLLGRETREPPPGPAPAPPIAAPVPAPEPAPPVETAILGRTELIALAAAAADAVAAGRAPPAEVGEAAGRRFALRLPFGCRGQMSETGNVPMGWRYDEGALRVRAEPQSWAAADWWSGGAPAGIEAIEGFWIARPWTSSEACPAAADAAAATDAEPLTLPGQTLAIGQIFAAEGSRQGRRDGKPYEAVIRAAEENLDLSAGLHLRLSGRIANVPGGGAVWCRQPAVAEQRPICLIAAMFDEVSIETAADGETLATWSAAGTEAPGR